MASPSDAGNIMTALRWQDITLRKGRRLILDGVSLSASRGEVLGIVGPNGAGKTALLRCAAGLERHNVGVVEIAGTPLTRLSSAARARAMAFLPQQAEAAWPISVAAAVSLGRIPYGNRPTEQNRKAIAGALDAVGMTTFAKRLITTLSGGERALVLLARALAVDADILLLDEPSAALDPHHQLVIMELFHRLAEKGKTVCVVLHDLPLAARFCDRLALLHAGRIVAHGSSEAVFADEFLQSVYAIRGVRNQINGKSQLVSWDHLSTSSSGGA
jgi:iron complex transport system ATP-binding protein